MPELSAGLIDVFAELPLSGNPLAVVEKADALSDQQMRDISREFNQAETTFLLGSTRADWKLRSFTASGSEVGGAGHNALGAWLWLGYHGQLGALDTPQTFRQDIGGDVLPITLERRGDRLFGRMTQSPLTLLTPIDDVGPLAEALHVSADSVLMDPAPRGADTGAAHLMVRVRDRETVDRAAPDAGRLLKVLHDASVEGCYVYAWDEARPGHAYARFFNPTVGLWEDSATGTAAGPLTAYLGHQGLLASDNALLIEQGTSMGRRSVLSVRLRPDPELSGGGIVVFRGTLSV